MKNFEGFMQALKNDEALAAKAKQALEGIRENAARIDALLKLAKEFGFEAEAEDFALMQAKGKELADEALSAVSGGDGCMIMYIPQEASCGDHVIF